MKLARRVAELELSPTLAVMNAAARLREQGVDVVDLGPGEPDFDTPGFIADAVRDAITRGETRYTDASGTRELRDAVAARYARRWGTTYRGENVVATCGGKAALYEVAMALCEPGDEVLIPAPYWVTFPEQVRLAGATPVIVPVPLSAQFVLDASMLAPHVTARTRALILNSPNNPTGAVIPEAGLRAIAALCAERGIAVVFDECYESFVYPPAVPFSGAALQEQLGELLVLCGSFSKTFAMTGHRLGFVMAGDLDLVRGVARLQSHLTSNPTTFVQSGGVVACRDAAAADASVNAMVDVYRKRRARVLALLHAIPGIRTPVPQGAFYVFPDVSEYLGARCPTSVALATYLLEEGRVAVVPGSAFGQEGHVRLSYATSLENLEKGIAGMAAALAKLHAA